MGIRRYQILLMEVIAQDLEKPMMNIPGNRLRFCRYNSSSGTCDMAKYVSKSRMGSGQLRLALRNGNNGSKHHEYI
jgi:hypothetical protein